MSSNTNQPDDDLEDLDRLGIEDLRDLSSYPTESRELLESMRSRRHEPDGFGGPRVDTREDGRNMLRNYRRKMIEAEASTTSLGGFMLKILRLPDSNPSWLKVKVLDRVLVTGMLNTHLEMPEHWIILCTNMRTREMGRLPGKAFLYFGPDELCEHIGITGCECQYEDHRKSLVSPSSPQPFVTQEPDRSRRTIIDEMELELGSHLLPIQCLHPHQTKEALLVLRRGQQALQSRHSQWSCRDPRL